MEFLNRFGTHYVQRVKMGSRYGYLSEFTLDVKKEFESRGISVDVAIEYSAKNTTINGTAGIKVNSEGSKLLEMLRSSVSIFILGSKPPANGDVQEWI